MIVTPSISDRAHGATMFFVSGFPVFFQKDRTPPPAGIPVDCMITKCIYHRFDSGHLDYSRLRFLVGSPVFNPETPSPLLVNHSGFHIRSSTEDTPVAYLTQDVIVNGTLVARSGDPIDGGGIDLVVSPYSSPHQVPGRIYIRKRDDKLRAVGVEDLSSLRYFFSMES